MPRCKPNQQPQRHGTAPCMSAATVRAAISFHRHAAQSADEPASPPAATHPAPRATARPSGIRRRVSPDRSSSSSSICSRLPVHRMIPSGAASPGSRSCLSSQRRYSSIWPLCAASKSPIQLDGDQSPQLAVVEQQIQMEILVVDLDALLPRQEGKARTQFQQEGFHLADDRAFQVAFLPAVLQAQEVQDVRVAHHQRRRHALRAGQGCQFLGDQFIRFWDSAVRS